MKLPQRKRVITLHMRSGARHQVVCQSFKIEKSNGNTLSRISTQDNVLPFYVRLDGIDSITWRKALLRWWWPV